MGLALTDSAIAELEKRTEGWIAALQMVALSLADGTDADRFIRSFAGTHRFILDYLVDEVLSRQTDAVRSFLLSTSILTRLTGPLCDAVTGRSDGIDVLAELERNNMLVVPLDERREWYRYHQLFADVLKLHAEQSGQIDLRELHRRASRWSELHDDRERAVAHALASADFEIVADLVERTWPELSYGVRPMTWLTWAEQIPGDMVGARPVLSAAYGWMLLDRGDLDGADTRLRIVETHLQNAGSPATETEIVVSNDAEFERLPGSTLAARAYYHLLRGETEPAIRYAEGALELLAGTDHFWRGTAALFLGLARWSEGNLDSAWEAISASVRQQQHAGNYYYRTFGMVIAAEIRTAQGRLRDAHSQLQSVIEGDRYSELRDGDDRSAMTGPQLVQDPVALYTGLGEIHRLKGELDAAEEHLNRGIEIRRRAVLPATVYRLYINRGRTRESRGDFRGALTDYDTAETLWRPGALPEAYPIHALRARVWLRQGRTGEAAAWAREHGAVATALPDFPSGFVALTWARIFVATTPADESRTSRVYDVLDAVAATAIGRGHAVLAIEALILRTLVRNRLGVSDSDSDSPIASLERAIDLAEPEGIVQPFRDEDAELEPLLRRALANGGNRGYARALLSTSEIAPAEPVGAAGGNRLLVEPLSPRELEVLRLVRDGHTNQMIADTLFISLSTVKKHLNNLFGKLTARNRTDALRRAREFDLL
jgi:LuxR family maltose regulon positive regulatory protein